MNKSKPNKLDEHGRLENVYLTHIAKNKWNDIQAYHIESANAWRFVALIAIVALVIIAFVAMYMINQDKHKILVFERDNLGNLSALGLATKTLNIDNRIVAHQLANFITAIREVPQDVAIKRRNINIVHKMSDSKLHEALDKMFITRYSQAVDGQVLVGIDNIKPLEGGKSWEIRWHENSAVGSTGSTEAAETSEVRVTKSLGRDFSNWSAVVTFKRLEILTPEVQLINPAGIFVTYFHPVEDISDKSLTLN